ncbi:MAG: WbuC family cupin fold metalloprotein [Phycisphaerae bacterium]|nr:WbuC family cupin fold metalloprotein [Phycisphaerae bacterium]
MDQPQIVRISPVATRSNHRTVARIDRDLVRQKAADAARSARKREIHSFHQGDPDTLQRMLNAIQPGSYVRPHRHLKPPKAESIIVLQGSLAFIAFADDASLDEAGCILIDPARCLYGCDIRPGVWHTIFALAPDTVVFEVKPGPYDPTTDKEFAPWSPPEGSPEAASFLADIEDRFHRVTI